MPCPFGVHLRPSPPPIPPVGVVAVRAEKTAREVLVEARGLIEKGWARGAFARYRNGKRTGSMDERACFFCVEGAICRAAFGTVYARREAMRALQEAAGRCDLFRWNDAQGSKRPILAAFDRAIEEAGDV